MALLIRAAFSLLSPLLRSFRYVFSSLMLDLGTAIASFRHAIPCGCALNRR
jgi:hypothetical protein